MPRLNLNLSRIVRRLQWRQRQQQNDKPPRDSLVVSLVTSETGCVTTVVNHSYLSAATLQVVEDRVKCVPLRRELFAGAEKIYCGEIFRFLVAIVDWETIQDGKMRTLMAYKIIATFVEPGSLYENNMSASTRNKLIRAKELKKPMDKVVFADVKLEIIKDVVLNPTLKALVGLERDSDSIRARLSELGPLGA